MTGQSPVPTTLESLLNEGMTVAENAIAASTKTQVTSYWLGENPFLANDINFKIF